MECVRTSPRSHRPPIQARSPAPRPDPAHQVRNAGSAHRIMMQFGGAPLGLLAGTAFTLLLASACAFDLRVRRIPNRLVAALAVTGMLYVFATLPAMTAVLHVLGGGAVGLLLWLPFWWLGVLGA